MYPTSSVRARSYGTTCATNLVPRWWRNNNKKMRGPCMYVRGRQSVSRTSARASGHASRQHGHQRGNENRESTGARSSPRSVTWKRDAAAGERRQRARMAPEGTRGPFSNIQTPVPRGHHGVFALNDHHLINGARITTTVDAQVRCCDARRAILAPPLTVRSLHPVCARTVFSASMALRVDLGLCWPCETRGKSRCRVHAKQRRVTVDHCCARCCLQAK